MYEVTTNLTSTANRKIALAALPVCVSVLTLIIAACGAPIQSPSDVAHQFSDNEQHSLNNKIKDLCGELSGRSRSPSLKDLPFDQSVCDGAGRFAANIRSVDEVPFLGLLEGGEKTRFTKDTAIVSTRGQFYLNEKLLNVAAKLAGKIGAFADGGTNPFDKPQDGEGGLSGLLNIEPIDIEKPTKRDDEISFELPLAIKADGIVRFEIDLEIGILVAGKGVAISLRSPNEVDLDKGLIRRIDALVLIVPHAEDVYVDLITDMRLNKLGTIDSLITGMITKFLPTLPKLFIDLVEKGGT